MSISLLPVTTTPKDFKAISEKLQASVKDSKQTYTEFAATDELSLTGSQRETYRDVMNRLDSARNTATAWKQLDNTTAFGTRDTNPDKNTINAISKGALVEASYDGQGVPTRFSYIPAGKNEATTLFQETNESIVFAHLDQSGSTGILFDKTTHQGTIFRAV